jgi:glycosyltransferase involved in cell wall biosynthesis
MRIFLHANQYVSHARAAAAYAQVFRRAGHEVVRHPKVGDVWFFHEEPRNYPLLMTYMPEPWRYRVGFAVYEADPLPEDYRRGVALVDELWVPSESCRRLFAPHHPRVRVVPHIAERPPDQDRSACDALGLTDDRVRLLHIGQRVDRRKGGEQLVRVFSALRKERPRLELVLKGTPRDEPLVVDGVVHVRDILSDEQITALYLASHLYVSPHSGEGWGLTLSDALALGRRTVATAWSGNLDFMRQADGSDSPLSVLVPASVEPIRPGDCYGAFHADQQWAYVSDQALGHAIETALSLPPPSADELARERHNLARFSSQAILEKVTALVADWPE